MIKNTLSFEERVANYIQLERKRERKSVPYYFGGVIVYLIFLIIDISSQKTEKFILIILGLGALIALWMAFTTLRETNPAIPPEKSFKYIFLTHKNNEIIGARETLRVRDYSKIRTFELPWKESIASLRSRKTFIDTYTNRRPAESTFEVWSSKAGARININIPGEEGPIFATLLQSKASNIEYLGFAQEV